MAEVKIAKAENPSTDAPKEVASEETASEELAISENTTAEAPAAVEEQSVDKTEEEVDFNVAEALAQRDYTPLVVQKIYQNISYPSRAVSKNQQGTVRVAIQIGRSGELKSTQTTQESKYSSLNRAALKAVEKAAPFPELPEQISAEFFELSIPITFRLK